MGHIVKNENIWKIGSLYKMFPARKMGETEKSVTL